MIFATPSTVRILQQKVRRRLVGPLAAHVVPLMLSVSSSTLSPQRRSLPPRNAKNKYRSQHWFQDRIHQDIQDGRRPCREQQQCPACLDIEHTLVIVMWRNPYDWISGMQQNPHHAKVL